MTRHRVHLEQAVRAPIEVVFERITDHEAMARWPGVTSCRLVEEGSPRNGVGAVREVRTTGLTLRERITLFEPPHGYDYTIVEGLPVDHLGQVRLRAEGAAVTLEWRVELSSRVPLLARVVARVLGRGLRRALAHFAAETEAALG